MLHFVRQLLIGRRNREEILRASFEAQLAERERLVQVLAEQVEYLRYKLGESTMSVSQALQVKPPIEPEIDIRPHISDDRDELHAMRQAGVLNDEEFAAALEALAAGKEIIE